VNEPKFLLAPNIQKVGTRHTTDKHTTHTFSRERTAISGTNYCISNRLSHQPIILKRHVRRVRIRQSANGLQWRIPMNPLSKPLIDFMCHTVMAWIVDDICM